MVMLPRNKKAPWRHTIVWRRLRAFAARYDPSAASLRTAYEASLRSELNTNISKVYSLNFRHHFESLTAGVSKPLELISEV